MLYSIALLCCDVLAVCGRERPGERAEDGEVFDIYPIAWKYSN